MAEHRVCHLEMIVRQARTHGTREFSATYKTEITDKCLPAEDLFTAFPPKSASFALACSCNCVSGKIFHAQQGSIPGEGDRRSREGPRDAAGAAERRAHRRPEGSRPASELQVGAAVVANSILE